LIEGKTDKTSTNLQQMGFTQTPRREIVNVYDTIWYIMMNC